MQTIRDGSELAGEAGKTMSDVTQAVARVTDIMARSRPRRPSRRGIDQVNLTITQMDETTQQNAALVEQAAAASKSLEAQGRELSETVAAFRMPSGTHVASPGEYAQAPAVHHWQPATA